MPRTYSEEFIRELYAQPETLGTRLGKVCIKVNFPAHYVADVLNVSRMTVHTWIRGKVTIRKNNAAVVEKFLSLVEEDLANGVLPAASRAATKQYLTMIASRMN